MPASSGRLLRTKQPPCPPQRTKLSRARRHLPQTAPTPLTAPAGRHREGIRAPPDCHSAAWAAGSRRSWRLRAAPPASPTAPPPPPRSALHPQRRFPLSGVTVPGPEKESEFLRHRVRSRLPAWASAGASSVVLSWLRHGVRLPWSRAPPRPFHQGVSLKDQPPAERAWLLTELQRLLDSGALEPATSDRYVTRAFLVPKPGQAGKWRLVVDLRWVNTHLRKQSLRMETLKSLKHLAQAGDYCFSLDLTDGFHCVPVHPSDRQYLTVHVHGVGLMQFAALPFGLTTSPFAFCKVMRSFVAALRSPLAVAPTAAPPPPPRLPEPPPRYIPPHQRRRPEAPTPSEPRTLADLLPRFRRLMSTGLRVLPYMDDFLVFCRHYEDALAARSYVEAVLDLLGLRRNPNKGQWEPVQALTHLGLGIDTASGKFFVPPERLQRLQDFATDLLCQAGRNRGLVQKRRLAAFAGLAQSLYLALPPARLFLRPVHDTVASAPGWSSDVRLSSATRTSLRWFSALPARWNGRDIWRSPHTAILHCDASKLAWGAVLNLRKPARGYWRPHQQNEHITLLELRAVLYACETFRTEIRGKTVRLWEDNQAVVAILHSWTTRSPDILRVLRQLWLFLDTNNTSLDAKYISTHENVQADALSRLRDSSDWQLHPAVFADLDARWGPHTVDRFATTLNTHCARFNSQWGDPRSEGVDAFAQDNWASELNWCNPPWSELNRLAQLLRETGASATVVAPHWPAQPWFQQLTALSAETVTLPPSPSLFSPGRLGGSGHVGSATWAITCFRVAPVYLCTCVPRPPARPRLCSAAVAATVPLGHQPLPCRRPRHRPGPSLRAGRY